MTQMFAGFPRFIFFAALTLGTLLFGFILRPFFFAIFWAVLLAAIFAPLKDRLQRRFTSASLCAGLTLAAVLVTLILPAGLILALLVGESFELYHALSTSGSDWMKSVGALISTAGSHPLVSRFHIDQQWITDKSLELAKAVADFLFTNLSAFTQNTILFLVQFAVMLYSLFYFLRDGEGFLKTLFRYMPVDERHMRKFVSEFLLTAKATLKFTFVIGGIQGLLGGLLFYITGIDRALVWGVLMVGLSIVPAVGNAIIWIPAGIIMLLLGHIWQGLAILVFGAVVISMVDNLLRPILMGHDIQMHPLLVFLSTLGGLAVFGFSGFVLGPVLASFFLAGWDLFLELYREERSPERKEDDVR